MSAAEKWQKTLDTLAAADADELQPKINAVNNSGLWQTRIEKRQVLEDGTIGFIASVPYLSNGSSELRSHFIIRKRDGRWSRG